MYTNMDKLINHIKRSFQIMLAWFFSWKQYSTTSACHTTTKQSSDGELFNAQICSPKSSTNNDFPLQPLFDNPHPAISNIQKTVAKKILLPLDAHYLPNRLCSLLHRVDAFQAVDKFLLMMGFELKLLLSDKLQRQQFCHLLYVLIEVDEICKETTIDDAPIYEVIKSRDHQQIETRIEKLHTVKKICSFAKHCEIVFPAFNEAFAKPLQQKLQHWETLNDDELQHFYAIGCDWKKLQVIYDEIILAIEHQVSLLTENIMERSHQSLLNSMASEIHRLIKQLTSGAIEPANGLETLQDIYEDLCALSASIMQAKNQQNNTADDTAYATDNNSLYADAIKKFAEILKLNGAGPVNMETLKTAYRKIIKLHHPDLNPHHVDANQKTQEINEAYNTLREYLGKGINIYA